MRKRVALVVAIEVALVALAMAVLPGFSSGSALNVPGRQAVAPAPGGVAPASGVAPSSPAPLAAPDPAYQPPLHGTNPHGQGTVAAIDVGPSSARPYSGNPAGTSNEVIVGRARGEQRTDGVYHGHITILSLLGNEILGIDTLPGQTVNGPLTAAQTGILDPICKTSGICLSAVVADSTTTTTGSLNHFETLGVKFGALGQGLSPIHAASSDGNIASDGTCQIATGDANVANVGVPIVALAQLVQSTSSTRTCNNGTSTPPTATSKVVKLSGVDVMVPAVLACQSGVPNTQTGLTLLGLLPIVCNADDTNGSPTGPAQTTIPYNVREALTLFVLKLGVGGGLAQITTGASESAANAPAVTTTTTSQTTTKTTSTKTTSTKTTSTCPPESTCPPVCPPEATCPNETTGTTGTTGATAVAAKASLPFTGYDATGAVLLGLVLLGLGLGGRRLLVGRAGKTG